MSPIFSIRPLGSASGERMLARLAARRGRVLDPSTERAARRLVESVRRRGDAALLAAVAELDGVAAASVGELRLRPSAADLQGVGLPAGFAAALEASIAAVEAYHRGQVVPGFRQELDGVELVERREPLARVAVYVPGGRACYPSTAVMTVVPARVAGVGEIVVVTPPRAWAEHATLRYTLARLGVEEIWGCGGAHAVAALAFGTASIARVDKIVGPGNAWVTAAKRQVAGEVAIDGLAGPSEVVIVAGADASPELVAADLLAQAEHDPKAAAILLTPSRALARAVAVELERQLPRLATAATARAALAALGGALLVGDLDEAIAAVARIAPEHLQLVGEPFESAAERFGNAGAIFVGAMTPEVFGDYVAGPSHVLPTCGTARFASALGVEDFVRRSHLVRVAAASAPRLAAAARVLAEAEGLPAHAEAARRREDGDEAGSLRLASPEVATRVASGPRKAR